jgi:hypothetical protein
MTNFLISLLYCTAFKKLLEILKEQGYDEPYSMLTTSSAIASATFKNDEVSMEEKKFISIAETKIFHQKQNSLNNVIAMDEEDKVFATNDGICSSKHEKLKLEAYTEVTAFRITPTPEVKRASSHGTHSKLGVYSMKSPKRGVFFFVNIIKFPHKKERKGADSDRENLVTLFRELGYKIFYYEDITREQFIQLIQELIGSDYLKGIDSFIMSVQTHGSIDFNQTIMEFADGATWGVEQVIELFSNKNCEVLANKPKVFFFPFCRGPNSDRGHVPTRYQRSIETDGSVTGLPSYSDIL